MFEKILYMRGIQTFLSNGSFISLQYVDGSQIINDNKK